LDLLHKRECRKVSYHEYHKVTASHHITSHDRSHDGHGKVVHRLCSSCISSNRNSIKFSLSNAEQRAVGLIPAWSLAILLSQTSFGHISINSSSILIVSMAMESPRKDLSIDTSHVLRQSIMAEILGRSTGNHHGTIY